MFRLKNILVLVLTLAIAVAGMPVYAGTGCTMKPATHHMMKDCPDCAEKSGNQAQHKDKCCGNLDCAISCSSVVSMNTPADAAAIFLPAVHTMASAHPSDDIVISSFIQTQERPPKHLA